MSQKEEVLRRLRRIEGQVRGLQRMVEEDTYCVDVLVQIAAARAALKSVGMTILRGHVNSCVVRAIREDHGEPAIEELVDVIKRFTD